MRHGMLLNVKMRRAGTGNQTQGKSFALMLISGVHFKTTLASQFSKRSIIISSKMLDRVCLQPVVCRRGQRRTPCSALSMGPAHGAQHTGPRGTSSVLSAQCLRLPAAQTCPDSAESSMFAYKSERRTDPRGFPRRSAGPPVPALAGPAGSLCPHTCHIHSTALAAEKNPQSRLTVELSLTFLRTTAKLTHRWFFLASLFFNDVFSTLSIKLKYCLPGITAHQVLYYRWN